MLGPALLLLAFQTVTVDDDGPADFPGIVEALQALGEGAVLLVEPGTYAPFSAAQGVTILGPVSGPLPRVTGRSQVSGTGMFKVAGLSLNALSVLAVDGRCIVDACDVLRTEPDDLACLVVEDSQYVELGRTSVGSARVQLGENGDAAHFERSSVMVVDCALHGADGADGDATFGDGGDGLSVIAGDVFLAGCSVVGGASGLGCGRTCAGSDGDGIALDLSAFVRVRGSGELVAPGSSGLAPPAAALRVGAGTLVWSGVTLGGALVEGAGATVVEPALDQPFIEIGGSDLPGELRELRIYGPPGLAILVFVSRKEAFFPATHLEIGLWLDPFESILIQLAVTIGLSQPVVQIWPVPLLSGLEGSTLWFQGYAPLVSSALGLEALTTNVANLTYRY